MSSFVVQSNVIDATLYGALWLAKRSVPVFDFTNSTPIFDHLNKLGGQLMDLNRKASREQGSPQPRYLYSGKPYLAPVCYKAAACLRYQISGQGYDDDPLYLQLDDCVKYMAAEIVMDLPDAVASRWANPTPAADGFVLNAARRYL